MIDIRTDWFRVVGSNAALLCRSRLPAPWGVGFAATPEVMFHFVVEGECLLRRAGAEPISLSPGDFALIPQGIEHDLVDQGDSAVESLEDFLGRTTFPKRNGAVTTLLCGVYGPDAELAHPIVRALPAVVRYSADEVKAEPSLSATLRLLSDEAERLGQSEGPIQHLFDALLVFVIRSWSERLSTLKDPWLSKSLSRIHDEPERSWTVEALASEAGLSRAAFARRFSEQVGEPPLSYLTKWRMGVAARLLRNSDASLAEIAGRVGYESEFAFSRAFKRARGLPPTRFRREVPERPGSPLP